MTDPTGAEGDTANGDRAAGRDDVADPKEDGILVIAVTVTRTGGFAGLRRSWHAEPDRSEAPQWITLIDQCPWDAADPARVRQPVGADRFVWQIDARYGDAAREAALADPDVQGPWRDLIDAVRAAQKPDRPPKNAR